jgi:transposase InsO family protein
MPTAPIKRLSLPEYELLCEVREKLRTAAHGTKAAVLEQAATLLNCDPKSVYRKLGAVGFKSGRKQRSDAGESILTREQLVELSGVLMASVNGKDQRMPIATAIDMVRASAAQRGEEFPAVSESTVSRQLYEHYLHPEQLGMPTAHVELTSKHPNHVWQVDSTTGAYYYLPQGRLRWMDEADFNKNKAANLVKASTDLLTRYSVADHTTHMFKVRYFLGGETAKNLLEFLVWAIWKQDSGPMCGAPLILMADQGPANKSHLTRLFCARLGIQLELHAPRNARATGSVEKSHDLARMHLETRYHFNEPADVTLAKLNTDAEAWCAAYCATRIHTRHGRTRAAAWMEINRYPGALRMPATLEALMDAAVSEPDTPRVDLDGKLRRTVGGVRHTYRLDSIPGVVAGLRVTVQTNVFRAPAIDVLHTCRDTGEQTWHVVEPEARDDWGFSGERVIGERREGRTNDVLDEHRNAVKRQAYQLGDGLPTLKEAEAARKRHQRAYAETIDPMADVKATPVPSFLPRRSVELPLGPARSVVARLLTPVEACVALKARMGAAYTPQVYAWVSQRFADGVPEEQLEAIAQQLAPAAPAEAPQGLRIVGGGAA